MFGDCEIDHVGYVSLKLFQSGYLYDLHCNRSVWRCKSADVSYESNFNIKVFHYQIAIWMGLERKFE